MPVSLGYMAEPEPCRGSTWKLDGSFDADTTRSRPSAYGQSSPWEIISQKSTVHDVPTPYGGMRDGGIPVAWLRQEGLCIISEQMIPQW